jgi:hypothetical protein
MSKYLFSLSVAIAADGGDKINSVTAGYVIKDTINLTYTARGGFTVVTLIPQYHEAIRRIVEEIQDQICIQEGLGCTSSSSPSSSL